MSDPDGPWSDRSHLTTLLREHSGAVPALLSLLQVGGPAAFTTVAPELPRASVAGALRWLAAEGLVEREGGVGSLDAVGAETVFRLTTLGAALASSIGGLARLMESTPAPGRGWIPGMRRPIRPFRNPR
jgi:hypothetical protein